MGTGSRRLGKLVLNLLCAIGNVRDLLIGFGHTHRRIQKDAVDIDKFAILAAVIKGW